MQTAPTKCNQVTIHTDTNKQVNKTYGLLSSSFKHVYVPKQIKFANLSDPYKLLKQNILSTT